jgi:hypothetical protein
VVIRSILQEDLKASLNTFAETLSLSRETIRTQMLRMGYTLKTLRWIPYVLTCELKQVRLIARFSYFPSAARTRAIIDSISSRGAKAGFATSMFEIEYGQHGVNPRLKSKIEPLLPQRYAHRFMEPHGFHAVPMLPPRVSFNISWFIDENFVPWPRTSSRLSEVQSEENQSCTLTMHPPTTPG